MALARASDLYRAGVDFHGVHNWATELGIPPTEPDYRVAFEASPMAYVKGWRSPVLLIQGDDDRDVQFNQTVMLADALRKQKVEVEELYFPTRSTISCCTRAGWKRIAPPSASSSGICSSALRRRDGISTYSRRTGNKDNTCLFKSGGPYSFQSSAMKILAKLVRRRH